MAEVPNRLDDHEGRRVNTLRGLDKDPKKGDNHELSFEAGKMRQEMLDRMTRDKGVISESEEREWRDKLMDAREDVQRMRRMKEEFETQMRESEAEHDYFDQKVHQAEQEGWLEEGEHEKLDQKYGQSRLEEKRALNEAFEKTLIARQKEIKDALSDIDGKIIKKHEKAIKEAKSWEIKKKEAIATKEHAQGLDLYLAKLNEYPIGKKTMAEFEEWYIEQGKDMQKRAPQELKKVIAPYVETWEIHNKLPKNHQNPDFKEMGRREREAWLSRKEREVSQKFDDLLHDKAKNYFSEKEMKEAENTFSRNNSDQGERLSRKATFLDALPGHIEAAKKLSDQFKQYSPEIQLIYKKEFRTLDYDDKKKMLQETIPREAKAYVDLRRRMKNLDKSVYDLYQDQFEDSQGLKEKGTIIKEAEKFQSLMEKHQDLRSAHKDLFNSPVSRSRERYDKEIRSVKDAEEAYTNLRDEIEERSAVHNGIQKLPPFLSRRIKLDAPFGKINDQYNDIKEIKKAYDIAIPFMIETGKKAEQEGNESSALNAYLSALKLDPESDNLKKMVAHLTQKGVTLSQTTSSSLDEAEQQALLEEVESLEPINRQTYELAREQIFLDLAEKHKQHVGATAGTVEARRTASLKVMSKEDAEVTNELEEVGALDSEWTVDETGVLRRIETIKVGQTQLNQTDSSLEEKLGSKFHKGGAAKSGTAETKFEDGNGSELDLNAVQRRLEEKGKQVEAEVIELAGHLLQRDHGLTKKQISEFQRNLTTQRSRTQAVDDQKRRLAA